MQRKTGGPSNGFAENKAKPAKRIGECRSRAVGRIELGGEGYF